MVILVPGAADAFKTSLVVFDWNERELESTLRVSDDVVVNSTGLSDNLVLSKLDASA